MQRELRMSPLPHDESLGELAWRVGAVVVGAICYVLLIPDTLSNRKKAGLVFIGTGTSFFVAPWIVEVAHLDSERAACGLGFLMALSGAILTQGFLKALEVYMPIAYGRFVERWFGRDKEEQPQPTAASNAQEIEGLKDADSTKAKEIEALKQLNSELAIRDAEKERKLEQLATETKAADAEKARKMAILTARVKELEDMSGIRKKNPPV